MRWNECLGDKDSSIWWARRALPVLFRNMNFATVALGWHPSCFLFCPRESTTITRCWSPARGLMQFRPTGASHGPHPCWGPTAPTQRSSTRPHGPALRSQRWSSLAHGAVISVLCIRILAKAFGVLQPRKKHCYHQSAARPSQNTERRRKKRRGKKGSFFSLHGKPNILGLESASPTSAPPSQVMPANHQVCETDTGQQPPAQLPRWPAGWQLSPGPLKPHFHLLDKTCEPCLWSGTSSGESRGADVQPDACFYPLHHPAALNQPGKFRTKKKSSGINSHCGKAEG